MAGKERLRHDHQEMVLNNISKKQEKLLLEAVMDVWATLKQMYPEYQFTFKKKILLNEIIQHLEQKFRDTPFHLCKESSFMTPDGGILNIVSVAQQEYPILISEKKNQGTNDLRALEGKKRQAQGNAIERLGKNVIGFRAALLTESIFPFVCFGDGCDFDEASSIPDRVRTIAMFGDLNTVYLHNNGPFNRGTFFFRPSAWRKEEMYQHCLDIAERSILYYLSKYGKEHFRQHSCTISQ
ncbi:MAG: type II restriction endonuclease [Kiritimatiellae bacterium]|nr:type II restriction endonuclease [Kiritimatiellia bacterium]